MVEVNFKIVIRGFVVDLGVFVITIFRYLVVIGKVKKWDRWVGIILVEG